MRKNNCSGQAIIVVLLIIVVALTIGLSITMRSIKDIKMSTRTEESQRAFSAAEAGLEAVLLSGTGANNPSFGSGGDLGYVATVEDFGAEAFYKFPDKIERDDTQQIWFIAHDEENELETSCSGGLSPKGNPCYSGSNIVLYWGDEDPTYADAPALEASLIYLNGGNYGIQKYAFDYKSRGNNFSTASNTIKEIDGYRFQYNASITDLNSGGRLPVALRLRLMYNNQAQLLGVEVPTGTLARQGQEYKSMGTAKVSGAGETETRTISFIKSYPTLPGIFDFALFSNSSLSK